jgi:hypothetical protein
MRLDIGPGAVAVTLSRRNLLALLAKLELQGSARTLISRNAYVGGECARIHLVVRAESDDDHYAERGFPPGRMHPLTERFIGGFDGSTGEEDGVA